MSKKINASYAACGNSYKKNAFTKKLSFGYGFGKYFLKKKASAKKCAIIKKEGNINVKLIRAVWNLTEKRPLRWFSFHPVESIKHDFRFYIPFKKEKEKEQFISFKKYSNSIPIRYISDTKARLKMVKKQLKNMSKKEELENYLKSQEKKEKKLIKFDCIILHFHGGGFVAQTSFSHSPMLRIWTKQTGIPVMSVDYTNPPEVTYPQPFEECYEAYKWILENGSLLGLVDSNTPRIILAGDSAGGNLAAAVCCKILEDGLVPPLGVLLGYPALNISFDHTLSRALFNCDPFFSYGLLKVCLQSYNPDSNGFDPKKEIFLSPLFASDQILSQFPKTVIQAGIMDPLLDDSVLFANRLKKSFSPVSLRVYSLPHGFWSYLNMIKDAKVPLNDAVQFFKELKKNFEKDLLKKN
ncbi:triacylglycerol lipase [Anaeramoeba ignava]|uniref:Triacylglycerol lipase n=1 Tax=Anaeramoeba ignava TaxID=1746090 RepID=A0A9Q0LQJ4_ANAIG|nr:triacylglycerol lipase [Anaeramoeba ignava]